MEIGTSVCRLIPSTTGSTLAISSPIDTSAAPGRVDSPPTSTIAAPASCRGWWMAVEGPGRGQTHDDQGPGDPQHTLGQTPSPPPHPHPGRKDLQTCKSPPKNVIPDDPPPGPHASDVRHVPTCMPIALPTAASTSGSCPPSLKLSGVTFSTPITSGRSSRSTRPRGSGNTRIGPPSTTKGADPATSEGTWTDDGVRARRETRWAKPLARTVAA
jgi:hypothetical protein